MSHNEDNRSTRLYQTSATQKPLENHRNSAIVDGSSGSASGGGGCGSGGGDDGLKEKKKVRRAFSMPRNPFRLSRRFNKTTVAKDADGKTVRGGNTNRKNDNSGNCAVKQTGQLAVPSPPSRKSVSSTENVGAADTVLGTTTTSVTTTATTTTTAAATTLPVNMNEPEAIQNRQKIVNNNKNNNNNNGGNGSNKNRIFRRPSWKKFLSRIAHQMTSINIGAKNSTTTTDRVPPLGGYVWPPDQIPGVTGLKNHGNTCFMNAVLQCLSHTDILAEYFVLDQYKADLKKRNKFTSRKFGTKGELTEQLALVLKSLWTCRIESDYSTSFKAVVDRYGTQFRSSTQHDAQEFLFWLLDKVHEDLNTASKRKYKSIKNSYGRSDEVIAAETLANHIRCNNSFVQAVFQAQFRSSLACPRCHKQSNTFDPFHCISVQLPQIAQQPVFVTVLYATQHPRQVKLGLGVPPGSPVIALREQLQADTGIPIERIILAEITDTGFARVFCDSHPMSSINETDPIYCIETHESTPENTNLTLVVANVIRQNNHIERFGTPFCLQVCRDISYIDLQKKLLKELQSALKPEVFAYSTPLNEMFRIRLQDPSADPDTYLEPSVEHPLFTEMIDLALSVLPTDVGPSHVKLLLEWQEPEKYFSDMTDAFVEHESVSQFKDKCQESSVLTLEQCLEHYTKAETLSAEDAWRCPNCQKYLPVVKTLGLWSLPDILVIHFKRFRQQHVKGPQAAKLTTTVKFPLNGFDMSPHLARGSSGHINSNEDNWSPWRKMRRREHALQPKDNRYDLYAVCYHQGDTLETGHYTAACKNPYDHHWYKFDDQKVAQVPAEKIPEEIVNNEAYMLFYQRRKLENIECSGSSSTTSSDHWVSKIAIPPSANSNVSARASAATLNTEEKKETVTTEVASAPALEKSTKIEQIHSEPSPSNTNSINGSKTIEVDVEINSKNLEKPIQSEPDESVSASPEVILKIRKTSENEMVDIEGIDGIDEHKVSDTSEPEAEILQSIISEPEIVSPILNDASLKISDIVDEIGDIQLRRNVTVKQTEALSTSVPTQRSLWPLASTPPIPRGSLNFTDMLSHNFCRDEDFNNIRHSLSTSTAIRQKDAAETFAMIREASSCSKDTLMFIDQPSHCLLDEETSHFGNKALWISPVTPHKFIAVSPKN